MSQTDRSVCRWCGEPATTEVEVISADINQRTMEVRKPAISAPVCEFHEERVTLHQRREWLEKEIRKAVTRAHRCDPHTANGAAARKAVADRRAELAEAERELDRQLRDRERATA